MIHITLDERIQLEDFLIDRHWVPGNHPNTWVQIRWNGVEKMDMPYFFLAVEQRSEDVFEVGGIGISGTWNEDEIRTHLVDVLRAGTEYGIRLNYETYLKKLGIEGAAGHAINLLRIGNGDLEVPTPPESLTRSVFFENAQGWCQFKWKGGSTIHITVAVHCEDADGYGTYSGFLNSHHGHNAVLTDIRGDTFPYGLFSDRRQRERSTTSQSASDIPGDPAGSGAGVSSVDEGDNFESVPPAGVSGLSEEVLLEVRGEPRGDETVDAPGSGECDS